MLTLYAVPNSTERCPKDNSSLVEKHFPMSDSTGHKTLLNVLKCQECGILYVEELHIGKALSAPSAFGVRFDYHVPELIVDSSINDIAKSQIDNSVERTMSSNVGTSDVPIHDSMGVEFFSNTKEKIKVSEDNTELNNRINENQQKTDEFVLPIQVNSPNNAGMDEALVYALEEGNNMSAYNSSLSPESISNDTLIESKSGEDKTASQHNKESEQQTYGFILPVPSGEPDILGEDGKPAYTFEDYAKLRASEGVFSPRTIMRDILYVNGVKSDLDRYVILTGKVSFPKDDTKVFAFVNTLQYISGEPSEKEKILKKYPYIVSRPLTAYLHNVDKEKLHSGDRVVFCSRINEPKKMARASDLLWVDPNALWTMYDLGLDWDSSTDEICERIQIITETIDRGRKNLLKKQYSASIDELERYERSLVDGIMELGDLQNEHDSLIAKVQVLRDEVSDLEEKRTEYYTLVQKSDKLKYSVEDIENRLNTLNADKEEIQNRIEEMQGTRTSLLTEIDEKQGKIDSLTSWLHWYSKKGEKKERTLITEGFSIDNFYKRLKYTYEEAKERYVERFLLALHTSQIITLCGKPGTGKTTFVKSMADAIGAKCSIIQVQNNWSDQADLLGYYNPINRTYQRTEFLEAIISALMDYREKQDKAPLHIICLDEMNLARVEYYFATFLSKLQLDNCSINLNTNGHDIDGLPDGGIVPLPPNVRFVGTLNMDETTNFLSPKVIDRCFFIEFNKDDNDESKKIPLRDGWEMPETYYSYIEFSIPNERDYRNEQKTVEGWFNKENNRFIKYTSQMYKYTHQCGVNDDRFRDDIVLSKVLPATTKISGQYVYSEPEEVYRLSLARFNRTESRIDETQWSFWG